MKHQEAATSGSKLLGFESERFRFYKKYMWVHNEGSQRISWIGKWLMGFKIFIPSYFFFYGIHASVLNVRTAKHDGNQAEI